MPFLWRRQPLCLCTPLSIGLASFALLPQLLRHHDFLTRILRIPSAPTSLLHYSTDHEWRQNKKLFCFLKKLFSPSTNNCFFSLKHAKKMRLHVDFTRKQRGFIIKKRVIRDTYTMIFFLETTHSTHTTHRVYFLPFSSTSYSYLYVPKRS